MVSGGGGPGVADFQPGDPRLEDGNRASRVLGPLRAEGARGVLVAVVSTFVVIGAIVFGLLHSPHWLEFKQAFFNSKVLGDSFPDVLRAFRRNIAY
ncbi:MAG: hypothetical protein ACXWEG_06160, partial [Actinomycetota bacterium]